MRIQWDYLATFLICVLYLVTVNLPSVGTFLFRRKNVHHVVNDPYQVKKDNITRDNLFAWLNMKNHIKFKLWTRRNPKLAHEIRIGDVRSIHTSNFDSRRLTKLIVHGYAHSANEIYLEDWIVSLRDAYLYLADLNVVVIDYTLYALPAFYWTAAPDLAARQLTAFIKFMVENQQITLQGLHLLGFSWGAHIAGMAGWALDGRIGRITGMEIQGRPNNGEHRSLFELYTSSISSMIFSGLDPAQPTFRLVEDNRRLDKSDALFVDILHTNSGRAFMEGHLGLGNPLGHADYYPNSGRAQPGCPLKWTYAYEEIECDHARSVNFFVESIVSPRAFPSCLCDNWDHYVKGECPCPPEETVFMGEHSGHTVRGKFYLFTRDKKPYGLGNQMNISLPDIAQYDPDFNNTGYHNHLRPYHLLREPLSRTPSTSDSMPITQGIHHGTIVTLDPGNYQSTPAQQLNHLHSYTAPDPPARLPASPVVYWEPQMTFLVPSEPVTEYSYLSDYHSDNHLDSNNFKRHLFPLAITSPSLVTVDQRQEGHTKSHRDVVTPPLIKPTLRTSSFSANLFSKYVNGSAEVRRRLLVWPI